MRGAPIRRRHLSGIVLIDCLIYIALLALILELAYAAFYRATEQSTRLERNATDIVRALHAGERWRQDVRSASGPPRVAPGAEEIALRIPHGATEIVYVLRDGTVLRQAAPAGPLEELLSNVKSSEFHRDARRHVTAWRWELELQGKQTVARVKPLFTFEAVASAEAKP